MVSLSPETPGFLKRAKRVEQQPKPQAQPQISQEKPQPSFLSRSKKVISKDTKFPLEGENDLEREQERAQARATSRAFETILGLPGDVLSFGASLFGKEQNILPTSEKLKEFSEKTTRGYTAPKSEFEEKTDEFTRDLAAFALPGSKSYTMFRNIGIPIASNLAKEGLKYSGIDDKKSSMGKIGSMVALDLLTQRKGMGGGAKAFSSNLFKKAEEAIPEGQFTNAKALNKSLDALENSLEMGGSRPSTKEALTKINEIRKDIQDGQIDVRKLAAYRPSINEMIESFGGFEMQLPKAVKQKAIHNLNQVKSKVIEGLSEYGEKSNPEFLKLHKAANESWAAYQNSNKIAKFLDKNAGKWIKNPLTKLLFLGGGGYGSHALAGKLGLMTGGASLALYPGFKVLHRVSNSPTLRNYYSNILKGALSGNSSVVSRNIKLLDKELSKDVLQKGSPESFEK